ncbi:MAG: type II secretion system protein [Patescibacteria group bacterium]
MAHRSWHSSSRKLQGFTVAELLVSIMILGLISVATITDLRTSQQADELATAARVVAADLGAEQNAALTGQNIRTCTDSATSKNDVCELSTSSCVSGSCAAAPPYADGLHFVAGSSSYDFFADVETTKNDWKETDATEIVKTRNLAGVGAANVVIDSLVTSSSLATVDVAFQRQNGAMGINACYAPCASPVTLRIILRHTLSNNTTEVDLNSYTGRVSIP